MSIEKFQPSYDIYPERIERLKAVAPEAFADGKINWDILKESLGSFVEDEDAETEHYAFTWPGKREARRMAGKPPQGTLVPVLGEGMSEETTENIFIEGDNLEVLKLLQKSYAGKIKMIYIDPPYNTGNDFIYSDNFTQPLEEYLRLTGQIDTEGKPLVTNKKADGRFHTKWLNMIYPRLSLAKNLLKDGGVIFISIDDNEIANLKSVCNELFGEENFISQIVWKKKTGAGSGIQHTFDEHEYLLVYGKNKESVPGWRISSEDDGNFKNPDNDERGDWESCAFTAPSKNRNPNQLYLIEIHFDNPNKEVQVIDESGRKSFDSFQYLNHRVVLREALESDDLNFTSFNKDIGVAKFIRRWAYAKQNVRALFEQRRVYFNGGNIPRFKKFESEYEGKALRSIYFDDFSTQQGTDALRDIFGVSYVEYPKPVKLIQHFIHGVTKEGDLVLDFFSGSGTCGHAVLNINVESGKERKFILVQLPEPCDKNSEAIKAGFKTIAEIGKERIRRVIKKIRDDKKDDDTKRLDLGFKVFKLNKSHFSEWQDYKGSDVKELMDLFAKQEDVLVSGWKPENLILEVMLQEGFPLHSKIEAMGAIRANKVVQVKSEFCQHVIFICLDEKVDKTTIEQLPLTDKDIFICLDKALTDEQKVALSDKGVIKTI